MLVYLTLGHSLCATQQYEPALIAYRNCLDMAVSTHDVSYQTKSLVNMASLHVSLGNIHCFVGLYETIPSNILRRPVHNFSTLIINIIHSYNFDLLTTLLIT